MAPQPPSISDDETLARVLQEEYEREFRRSQPALPSAPTENSVMDHRLSQRLEQEERDAAFARRLEQQSMHPSSFAGTSVSSNRAVRGSSLCPPSESTSGFGENGGHPVLVGTGGGDDVDFALRTEQELIDEEYARRLAAYEEQQISSDHAQQLAEAERRRCTPRRVCGFLFPLAIIAAAIAAVVYYVSGSSSLPDFIPDPEAFREEDPFSDTNPADANRWRNNGEGLELTVLTALDPSWEEYFYAAVKDWDAGTPDALTLYTDKRDLDEACGAITGYLKVCNGNYGSTNWRGINKVLLENGYIYASAARMNEHYFRGKDDAQRRYTMCHEIGHGFGLPHTDENFFNKDLGNCMDYTNRPEANQMPDASNYNFLNELYGSVPNATSVKELPGDRKLGSVPDHILTAFDDVDEIFNGVVSKPEIGHGWRLLHRSDAGEAHELELGEGFTVQVHKLLVSDTD